MAICAASGDLPNQYCPQTRKTCYIPGVSAIKVSTLHQAIIVDNTTGKRACPPYNIETTHQAIYEFWSSELKSLFAAAELPRREPPPINEQCSNLAIQNIGGKSPEIKTPLCRSLTC